MYIRNYCCSHFTESKQKLKIPGLVTLIWTLLIRDYDIHHQTKSNLYYCDLKDSIKVKLLTKILKKLHINTSRKNGYTLWHSLNSHYPAVLPQDGKNSSLISGLIFFEEDAVLIHSHCGSINVVSPCDTRT